MSFIPSFLKSLQQVAATVGANVISAVTMANTELVLQGVISGDSTGTVNPNKVGYSLTTTTNIQGVGQGANYISVREYLSQFLRQSITYGTVTILNGNTSVTIAHGLTLGAKAYINYLGHTGTRGPSPSGGLALTEAQVFPRLQLTGANIVATVNQAPYVDGDGVVVIYYCIVDPK